MLVDSEPGTLGLPKVRVLSEEFFHLAPPSNFSAWSREEERLLAELRTGLLAHLHNRQSWFKDLPT